MSDALGTLEKASQAVGKLLERLISPLDSSDPVPGLKALMADLGWTIPEPIPPALTGLVSPIASLVQKANTLVGLVDSDAPDAQLISAAADVVGALARVISALEGLPAALAAQLPAGFAAATDFANQFVPRLLDVLIVDGIRQAAPVTSRILRLLGLIEMSNESADAAHFQPNYVKRRVHWDRITTLLSNPQQILSDVYGWGTPTINLQPLQEILFDLSCALGFPGAYDFPTPGLLKAASPTVAVTKGSRLFQLVIFDNGIVNASAAITTAPANPGENQGVAIVLTTTGSLDALEVPLGPNLDLTFTATIDASAGIALVLKPGQAPGLVSNFDGPSTAVTDGKLTATLAYSKLDNEDPFVIFGFPGGSRIEAREAYLLGGLGRNAKGDLDPQFEGGIKTGKFILSTSQMDGFLSKLLPGDGVELDFDIGVGWSRTLGIYVQGNAGLSISIPLHLDLGPISLESLNLSVDLTGGNLALSVALSGTGNLGPLAATVDQIGVTATSTFPGHGGNLGPANVALSFKPPNGVGLSVDAGVVQGGGFLYIDTEHGEYAGALQLMFADFLGLQAIGLITTKMPDGSSGFSLLIIITVDFGAGIQLGFGFTLLAVGGLLGLNRCMLFQPLMDGIRSDSIESIMFPQDVIANATRIISDLRAIFPPQQDTFLIGPMAKLGWGEPTLISLALGVIIEIPPGDIAILGVLKLALPADDIAILLLQVNFAGALEFDKSRLYFFASLYDSHILFITLEGEMGLLMAWGGDANFVVSIGGFHPQFNPPPLPFPTPRRIEVDIINESYARIRCDGYFAVTSNTVQFGAHSEYFFGFSALNLSGSSGFDALIQFSPFQFVVSVSTSFNVSVFGLGLYGIDMDFTLSGPTPWHVHGTASISFLFFSIGIGVDFTWGDSRNTMLPPVAVMPIISGEYGKQSNWKAVLPNGSNLLVALRKLDPSESVMVLHPVGTLQISQRAMPIDLTLDKDGNQQPSDANYFTLDVTSGGLSKLRTLQEQFAPAQFKNMDDATKLSQPAYVPLDSGIELAAGNTYASGTAITRNVRYDLTVIDTKYRRVTTKFFTYLGSLFTHFLTGSSVTRSVFSARVATQKQPYTDHVSINPETFAVALVSNNKVYSPDAASFPSQAAAQDHLARAVANDPTLGGTLHVLPQFEVAA